MGIKIYSMESCHHCTKLKEYLNDYGIKYTVIDIDKEEDKWNEVMAITKSPYVPIISYIENKKTKYLVPSIHFETIEGAVEIIKSI